MKLWKIIEGTWAMSKGTILVILGALALIPIWRSGLRENMSFYEFIISHTVFSPNAVEYIPEEYLTRGETLGIYMEIR